MSHRFGPILKEPAYLKVYRAIEADILSGRVLPGAALPTEGALAEQFGLTRSTVREGIRLLEEAGLVARGAAKRLLVTRPGLDRVADRASRGLAMSGVTFLEVWEAMMLVEPEAARLAAERATAEDLALLEAVRARVTALDPTAYEAIATAAVEFFAVIADATRNQVLSLTLSSLNLLIAPSLLKVMDRTPNAARRIAKAQAEIIRAVRDGDGASAADWMGKHVADLRRGYTLAGVDLDAQVL